MNQTSSPIRVLIAEDHELARTGLSYAIQGNPHFQVIGETDNGAVTVEQASTLHPDVVLMDIDMPVMDGIEATRKLKEILPTIKIIMLTSQSEQEQVYEAFSAGADGYCLKDIRIERLFTVIDMVAEGGLWIDPPIAGFILSRINRPADSENASRHLEPQPSQGTPLTEREMETLTLIVAGKSNKEIAAIMTVSTNTIKTYVGKIIQKLAVDDRTQAAVKALQSGLVKPDAE